MIAVFNYFKFNYYRPCAILTLFLLHVAKECFFLNIDEGLFLFHVNDKCYTVF